MSLDLRKVVYFSCGGDALLSLAVLTQVSVALERLTPDALPIGIITACAT
ncbi:hypothetical protein HNQ77_002684 [Silvibacterium bohemicum]|uniref:Uncharacterized protein n=1 Tax=Silvibacterium bohemicum TaxID=1577686 RepID=A0A841K254_9BACT|nr:hypothetical protein [Silvibacterium bohemicum]